VTHGPLARRALLLLALGPIALGCGRKRADPDGGPSSEPAPGAESPPPVPRAPPRCAPVSGAPSLTVGSLRPSAPPQGSEEGEEQAVDEQALLASGAVEFARGAVDAGSFFLGLLRHEQDTRALVAVLESGGARLLDLGRVDPRSEPPRVAARGGHFVGLVTDAVDGVSTLRLVGIRRSAEGLETRLGPEVKAGKSDASGADVAVLASGRALVVWERAPAVGKSEIVGQGLDVPSLREKGAPIVLTPATDMAAEPRLVAGKAGYWLLWLVEAAPADAAAPDAGLLVEPPRVLFARELDEAGLPRGAPVLVVRDQAAAVVFDARVLPSGHLLVVHRSSPADRPSDDQPIQVSIVDPAGTVRGRFLDSPELELLGAPTLLGQDGVDASWLALEDTAGTTVLAHVSADGSLSGPPLAGLGSRVALAGEPGRLLTAQPRGLGVELGLQSCRTD